MEIKRLFGLLTLLNGVSDHSWKMVMDIVECFNNNTVVKVIDKQWADDFKRKYTESYPLDLGDIHKWSTYDRTCIDLQFTNKESQLYCEARIYHGNNFDGYRRELNFTAEFILPDEFILKIEENINYAFDYYLEDQYEKHLQLQKEKWIKDCKAKILGT